VASGAYDFKLKVGDAELGLMLAEDENQEKVWNEGVSPLATPQFRTSSFSYEHIPPDIDQPIAFEQFVGGCARFAAFSGEDVTQYNYSQRIDLSQGDRAFLSPLIKKFTFDTAPTKPFNRIFESSLGLHAITDEEIYKFNKGTKQWELKEGPNSGAKYTDIKELDSVLYVSSGGIGAKDYEFSTDGLTFAEWNQTADDIPVYLTVRGNTLWGVEATGLTKNTQDGQNSAGATAWSAGDEVGHTGETVTGLLEAADILWIFKKEAIYTFDPTAVSNAVDDFYHESLLYDENGHDPFLWKDGLIYVAYGRRLLQIDPFDNTLVPIFPVQGTDSTEVQGKISGITGDGKNLMFFVKNDRGGTYLVKGSPSEGTFHTYHYPYHITDTGYLSPHTAVDDDSNSAGNAWTTPQHVANDETASAGLEQALNTSIASGAADVTSYLRAFKFPFRTKMSDLDDIVGVEIQAAGVGESGTTATDETVKLWYNGAVAGDNRADSNTWGTTTETKTWGAANDMWGVDFNTSIFLHPNLTGFVYAATLENGSTGPNLWIDNVKMKVHYHGRGPLVDFPTGHIIDGSALGEDNPVFIMAVDNTLQFFKLNRPGYTPREDPGYEFEHQVPGLMVGPWIDFGARAFDKFLNLGDILAHNASASNTIVFKYETEGGGHGAGGTNNVVTTLVRSEQNGEVSTAPTSDTTFNIIRYQCEMKAGGSSTSPELLGLVLHSTPNPPRKRIWRPRIVLGETLNLRSKARDILASATVKRVIQDAPTKRCVMTDREGNTYTVRVLDENIPGFTEIKRGGQVYDKGAIDLFIVEINQTGTPDGTASYAADRWGAGKVWSS
jgi:hypothetical protein